MDDRRAKEQTNHFDAVERGIRDRVKRQQEMQYHYDSIETVTADRVDLLTRLDTERTLLTAWQKRAYEAEARAEAGDGRAISEPLNLIIEKHFGSFSLATMREFRREYHAALNQYDPEVGDGRAARLLVKALEYLNVIEKCTNPKPCPYCATSHMRVRAYLKELALTLGGQPEGQ